MSLLGCLAWRRDLTASSAAAETLANAAYRLEATPANGNVHVVLFDKTMNLPVADGPYLYRAERQRGATKQKAAGLTDAKIAVAGDKLTIRGELAGLELEHTFTLPADRPIMEERIVLHNKTGELIALTDFEAGLTRPRNRQGRQGVAGVGRRPRGGRSVPPSGHRCQGVFQRLLDPRPGDSARQRVVGEQGPGDLLRFPRGIAGRRAGR